MTTAWIVAITVIVLGGTFGIVAVHLWGSDAQEQATVTSIVTFLGPTIAALLALYKADQAVTQSRTTHDAVNGALLTMRQDVRRAGVAEGRAAADAEHAPDELPPWPGGKR